MPRGRCVNAGAQTKKQKNTLDDIVVRSGSNIDIVLGTIAATLISPTAAVVAALLATLYASNKTKEKSAYTIPQNDYSGLKQVIYEAIEKHNYGIKKKLVEYGIPETEADKLLYKVIYESYLDTLIRD